MSNVRRYVSLEADQAEIDALFSEFLPADLASRYSKLLSMKPAHWKKIDPWRVWQQVESGSIEEWHRSVQDLLRSPKFARHAEQEAVVLRCGHDRPSVERRPLSSALVGQTALFEGFISVAAGKLGIAINHDGEICVLSK